MKRFLLPAACLLAALAGANALAQSAPIVIRFTHVVGADTPKGRAAELFRMVGEIGVVATGARADLIAVDGNPLDDLNLLVGQGEHLDLIMKDGRIYKNTLP